jgi:sugar phosphate isomerase/epimerase
VADLLADPAKAKAWKKKFEDRNIRVGALNTSGNPLHPNAAIAKEYDDSFRQTVLLAERLEIPVIVNFSGCPGDSPSSMHPSWVTYRWPPEYNEVITWQWEKVVLPYWRDAVKFARAHGVKKIALEMHPNFVVYNPFTVVRLRDAVGEEIGANCDLSHLFWQGCDPLEAIRFLGKQGAIFHAHMKDTVVFKETAAQTGVLNFSPDPARFAEGSVMFRTVGYGHGAQLWKDVVKTYMDIGYAGILSIEHEDSLIPGEIGIERAALLLKNVRAELLQSK